MGHLYSGCAAECPGTVPVGDSASPPVTWRWLALTEITIVVDFINRVSEVLKARRVSRGYLGWTAWMPHAHWYGVPSLSCMLVCFLYLGCYFLIPPKSRMPQKHLAIPSLPISILPSQRRCCQKQALPFRLWFTAVVSITLWHEEKCSRHVNLFTTASILPSPSLWQLSVD